MTQLLGPLHRCRRSRGGAHRYGYKLADNDLLRDAVFRSKSVMIPVVNLGGREDGE